MRRDLLALCALVVMSRNAFALNPALDISQYAHASWKNRDGFARGTISAIAQTPDGYLWLATEASLLRFDGVRTVSWPSLSNQRLPSDLITGLLATRDGTLWIGTSNGLAAWTSGRLTTYEKFTGHLVGRIIEDGDGVIWITTFSRSWFLCAIQHGRVMCYGEDGGPGANALGLYENRRRELWVGTVDGLWKWKPGPPQFYSAPLEPDGIQAIAENDDGTLLFAHDGAVKRLTGERWEVVYTFPAALRRAAVTRMLRDRDGGLWIATSSLGLIHAHQGKIEVMRRRDGLLADGVFSLFEDREGNVWAGSAGGLERFRSVALATFSVDQGLPSERINSVVATPDGTVWVATFEGLVKWRPSPVALYRDPVSPVVHAMFEDARHRLWLSTRRGISRLEHDRLVPIVGVPGGVTRGIGEDIEHTLWIANLQRGLFHVQEDGTPIGQFAWSWFGSGEPPTAMTTRRSERGVWLAFNRGIVHVSNDQVQASYGTADGLGVGAIRSLQFDRDDVLWAATDGGLSRVDAGRIATLTTAEGLPCDSAQWMVEDDDRSLWVSLSCGLVRIARSELNAWIAGADNKNAAKSPIHPRVFDPADGAWLFASAFYYSTPAAKASDGTLWFMVEDGVAMVDPRHVPLQIPSPTVYVEDLIADRQVFRTPPTSEGRFQLPALTRDLRIEYTALSLGAPEKVRFRYKLEGQDRDWQSVGTRRQAFYNDLRPGSYRFNVIASDAAGAWREVGASIDVSIAPMYYQTTWFRALAVTLVLAFVWAAHRVRLRIVETHEREITALNERMMKAQEQERMRIAGELHDGVMQQMLSMTMMVGTAKRRIADPDNAAATLDQIQEKLVQVGADIRQLSHGLHPPMLQEAGLPDAMRAYCNELSVASGLAVLCDCDDSARELSRGTALALFRILQEALGNAAKHANARRITVRLTRTNSDVALMVSDDGAGFDSTQVVGGLGLVMMRERATQLNGTFHFASTTGRGTTISVVVPFR